MLVMLPPLSVPLGQGCQTVGVQAERGVRFERSIGEQTNHRRADERRRKWRAHLRQELLLRAPRATGVGRHRWSAEISRWAEPRKKGRYSNSELGAARFLRRVLCDEADRRLCA